MAHRLGGLVEKADDREYGRAILKIDEREDPLFAGLEGGAERVVWMSHGDRVLRLPEGWVVLGTSESSPFCAVRHRERPVWGVQFHPEVVHTEGAPTSWRTLPTRSALRALLDHGGLHRG